MVKGPLLIFDQYKSFFFLRKNSPGLLLIGKKNWEAVFLFSALVRGAFLMSQHSSYGDEGGYYEDEDGGNLSSGGGGGYSAHEDEDSGEYFRRVQAQQKQTAVAKKTVESVKVSPSTTAAQRSVDVSRAQWSRDILKELNRRSGGSTVSSLENWFYGTHPQEKEHLLALFGTFQGCLRSFPKSFVLSRKNKMDFVYPTNAETKKSATTKASATAKGTTKTTSGPKQKTADECHAFVTEFIKTQGGSCFWSDVGTHLRRVAFPFEPTFSSLKGLLQDGATRGIYTLRLTGKSTWLVALTNRKISPESLKPTSQPAIAATTSGLPHVYTASSVTVISHQSTVAASTKPTTTMQQASVASLPAIVASRSAGSHSNGTIIVREPSTCALACEALSACEMIALDCEGVNLGQIGGSLCLIQIASPKGVFLFDGIDDGFATLMRAGLKKLLENRRIVKVVHDCQMDVRALLMHCHVKLACVFDTQLAFSIVEPRARRNVSLVEFIQPLTGKTHPQKERAPHKLDPIFWSRRPLVSVVLLWKKKKRENGMTD